MESRSSLGRAAAAAQRVLNFAGRFASALSYVAVSFTVGLASPRRRALISLLAREAGYRESPRTELPQVHVAEITSAQTPVVLPFPETRDGSVTLLELTTIARLVRERQPGAIFEIGTFDGRTTSALAANAPANASVFTLDVPPDHPTKLAIDARERVFVDKPASGSLLRGTPWASRVTQLYGDSASFDFAPYRAQFVFVDGSHAYEYVLSDTDRALRLLDGKPGMIVWHDYGEWAGVTRALNELRTSDARCAGLRHVRGTSLALLAL